MDLIDAGVFITCLGSFMSLASIPKVLIDKVRANRGYPKVPNDEIHEEWVYKKWVAIATHFYVFTFCLFYFFLALI